MFSAPSKFLRSQQRSFPAVVIPKDRQKVEFSFSSSPSTSLTGTSNPDNHHLKKEEENSRVMQLAQRVDKILSEIGTTVRTAPSTSNNSIEEKTMIDIPSSTMTEQEKYIDDAESLLRGGSSSSSSSSSSVSAELAWANRILNQNKHDEETNTQAFSSSAPSQKDAMMHFLKMTSSSTTSSSSSTSSSVAKNNNGKSLLDQLRNGNKPMLTETQQSELVDYLDSLVERRIDTFTFVQEGKTSQRSSSAKMMNGDDSINVEATDDDSAILKQARFLRALLNVRNLLENECGFLPRKEWFVACGTALGFRREKKFIAHDNDIDIGILYSDEIHDKIIKLVAKTSQVNVMTENVNNNQNNRSMLICFEKLGTKIHFGGFQLRLIDSETGVMIDINLYYRSPVLSSIEEGDSSNSKGSRNSNQYASIEPFVCQQNVDTNNNKNQKDSSYWWFATFYEQAERRKYGMYRYHFSSEAIEEMLSDETVQISSFTTEDDDKNVSYEFPCPGHLYLQEYFGKNYMTPIQYTYEEAIAEKRYSNMIDE